MSNEEVTITMPAELVREIDRVEQNRSKFLQDAARHELERRRRASLAESLQNPHLETAELSEIGFQEWVASLTEQNAAGLVDPEAGTEIRWVPGEGWTAVER